MFEQTSERATDNGAALSPGKETSAA
jgi:hypothetical protein